MFIMKKNIWKSKTWEGKVKSIVAIVTALTIAIIALLTFIFTFIRPTYYMADPLPPRLDTPDAMSESYISQPFPYEANPSDYTESDIDLEPKSPAISISAPTNTFSLSGNGRFFISPILTVDGSGFQTYTVTLINAGAHARIVTTSENPEILESGAVLPAGINFYIKYSAETIHSAINPIVAVSAVGKYPLIPYGLNVQEATLLHSTKDLSAQITLELTPMQ